MKYRVLVFSFLAILFVANTVQAAKMPGLSEGSGLVTDFNSLRQAESALRNGNTQEAARLASRVNEDGLSLWKNLVLAEIDLAQNEPRQVLARLHSKIASPKPEFSFGESRYLEIYARYMKARYQALTALGENASWEAGELYVLDPEGNASFAGHLDTRQKANLVHRLHFNYQYKKVAGIVSASEIANSDLSKEEKCQSLYELGNSLRYSPGQAENSTIAFSKLVDQNCPEDLEAKGLYWLGYMASSTHSEGLAKDALTRLFEKYPNHRLADDAIFLLRKMYDKMGNKSLAQKYEDKLISWPRGDMRNQFLFDQAYPFYKRHDYRKAAKIFAFVVKSEPTPDESYPRALYWQSRAFEKTKNKANVAKAKAGFQRLVSEFPFSFYAVLAANRLGTSVKVPSLPTLTGSAPSDGQEFFSLMESLNRKGYRQEARDILDIAVNLHPDWEKNNLEFVTKKYLECGNYRKALDLAALHFDSGVYGPTQVTSDPMFAAFYPRAYSEQTSHGYSATNLPRGAIEGIMREESLFQRDVRSWVGATGLMQLMPATAQLLRRKIPNGSSLTDLTDPRSNIILGSTYLSDMKDFFGGQLPLAIMAYNAGPGNVKKWLRTITAGELDEFIEDIPFTETKGYVKRVMRSMQVYGSLYQEPYFKKPFFNFNMRVAAR